jgi:hypothetical protein
MLSEDAPEARPRFASNFSVPQKQGEANLSLQTDHQKFTNTGSPNFL